jgi:hypothetical protein
MEKIMLQFKGLAAFQISLLSLVINFFFIWPVSVHSQDDVPDKVLEIFENKCAFAGCHAGASSTDLDLTEKFAYASLVNQPSSDFPNLALVKAGDPLKSYLIMKLVGASGIKGARMPKGSEPLSKTELKTIAAWIKSLPQQTKVSQPKNRYSQSFVGLSLATQQTAQTMPSGSFSYRIAHRWLGRVDDGFSQFFGLDAGAHMLTEFSFPLRDNLMFTVGRSGTNATFELNAKWQFLRERTNNSVPVSAAIFTGLDWLTVKQLPDPQNPQQLLSRTSSERLPWFIQLILTRQLSNRIALLLSPGVLFNGNVTKTNEQPIFTIGFGGKFRILKGLSIFAEGVTIVSGIDDVLPVGGAGAQNGQPIVYDPFTIGLEHNIGGHVFHLYVSNSLGLTPTQMMSGGNLDFANGELRLGFNIYRLIRFP